MIGLPRARARTRPSLLGVAAAVASVAACTPTFHDEYCLADDNPSPACRAKLGLDNGGAGGQSGSPIAGAAGSSSFAGRSGSAGMPSGGQAGASGTVGGRAGGGGSSGKSGAAGNASAGSGGIGGSSGAGNGGAAGTTTAGSSGAGGAAGAPGCTLPQSECEAVIDVAIGKSHVCYLRFEGTVFCWGKNDVGQLGSGFAPGLTKTIPTRVDELDDVVRLASGSDTTCAVRKSGEVLCWGSDAHGQLGRAKAVTGDARGVPAPVVGVTGARDITVGPVHACASDGSGKVFCWGDNQEGQLDKETSLLSRSAVSIALLAPTTVARGGLAATATRTCAVQADGTVSCLGNDRFAAEAAVLSSMLNPVPSASAVSAVSAGAYFACGLQPGAGTVTCWGRADEGQLGISPADSTNSTATARAIPSLEGVTSLATGSAHTCAALSTGEVLCWGDCSQGQCGNGAPVGTVPEQASPALVPSVAGVAEVYAGESGSCARLSSGGVGCWGAIAGGTPVAEPVAIPSP